MKNVAIIEIKSCADCPYSEALYLDEVVCILEEPAFVIGGVYDSKKGVHDLCPNLKETNDE